MKKKKKKPFKILSIDGGGIKGLYSAALLSRLEEQAGLKSGECFDLIAGTSTGGLIALGLASGKKAEDLVNLYEKFGKSIFPTSNWRVIRWFQDSIYHFSKQTFMFGKYGGKNLKKALVDEFGDKTLGELDNLLVLPSFNLINGMPRVFKFPHKEGEFFRDKNIPLVDAALATSAAPTYLPIHEYDNTLYVDGGVWANNPSLCAVAEAIQFFVGKKKEYSHIEILSISCIPTASGWVSKSRKRRSFFGWTDKLFQTSMDGQAYFADFFLRKTVNLIAKKSIYKRINSPSLSTAQMKVIQMDRADNKAISTLKSLGDQHGFKYANNNDVMHFFKTKKTYVTN